MTITRIAVIAALAGAVVGLVAVYGMGGLGGNRESAACPGAAAVAGRLGPLAKGEVAALNVQKAPQPLPALAFNAPDGKPLSLADFRGRTVLLNLWATWCVPCRKEMPALDALQAALGGPGFAVVAVNIDTTNPAKATAFLDEIGIKALERYADPSAGVFYTLKKAGKAFGMPTTILVDPSGCELANLAGPAEWASAEALDFVRAALAR